MAKREWTPAQNHCIHDTGGTLLVSAAAGSGKTSVLVERIIQKVTHPDHPISVDHLLVMTFTNAAAAEMKQRIAKELASRLSATPDDIHLQRQQLALPRAAFGTVHSFCFNLIRENAYRLNLSPQFKIAEEQQLLLLRKEAMEETLSFCYEQRDARFLELVQMLSNGKNDKKLMGAVESIYNFIQSHPYPELWLSQMETVYDANEPIQDTVWGKLLLRELTDRLTGYQKLLSTAAALCEGDEMLTANYLPSLAMDVATLTDLLNDIQNGLAWDECFLRAEAFSLTDVTAVRKTTDENAKRRITDLRESVRKRIKSSANFSVGTQAQCLADLKNTGRIVSALYEVVRRFSACFAEKKRLHNLLDFNDAEHYALQLLTETDDSGSYRPSALARELSKQYDEIMVDEYQDTNASQDALFSAISKQETNLFYVGDVKQSIYRFRQAMPELFIRRRNTYAPYGGGVYPATITLGNNFRSRLEVTDAVNFLFRQLMSEQTGDIRYGDQEALVCSAEYPQETGHETECLILDKSQWKDTDLTDDTAQARMIAERIHHFTSVPCVSENGSSRPARYGDICILLRSKKEHAAAYRDELERLGIPVAHESSQSFLSAVEIRLALSLLRTIDNPMLDVSLSAVMLSPLFGFTPDELTQIRLCSPESPLYFAVSVARKHDEAILAERCTTFLQQLDLYRSWAASLTVDALVRRIYEHTSLPELMLTRTGGTARKNNLQQLHDLCRRFDSNGFRGLSAFIRYIDLLQEQGGDFPAASSAGAGDAVSILSVHASKGLEYPIVFLAGLGTEFNTRALSDDLLLHPSLGAGIRYRDPQTLNRYDTLPRKALSIALRNDSLEEELRVLYVAMTRAREKLVLVLAQKDPLSRLEELACSLTPTEELPPSLVFSARSMGDWVLAALLRHPSSAQLRHDIEREDLPLLSAQTNWHISLCNVPLKTSDAPSNEEIPAKADPAVVDGIRQRMAYHYPNQALSCLPAKLAASQVAHQKASTAVIAHSRPSFMSKNGLTPSERGTAMHTFMQFCSFEKASCDLISEITRLTAMGFLDDQQAESLDQKRLSAFFKGDLYRRIQASDRVLREYHFTSRMPAAALDPTLKTDEFLVVQGIADCVFKENGKLVIVDYKTDHVDHPNQLIERYRPQLDLYRDALAKALELPVAECLLYSFALNQTITI